MRLGLFILQLNIKICGVLNCFFFNKNGDEQLFSIIIKREHEKIHPNLSRNYLRAL